MVNRQRLPALGIVLAAGLTVGLDCAWSSELEQAGGVQGAHRHFASQPYRQAVLDQQSGELEVRQGLRLLHVTGRGYEGANHGPRSIPGREAMQTDAPVPLPGVPFVGKEEFQQGLMKPGWTGPTTLWSLIPLAAALACLALAVTVLLRPPLDRLHWSFVLGILAFGVQSVAAGVLLAGMDVGGDTLFWLRLHAIAGLLALIPWALFVTALTHRHTAIPTGWRIGLAAASGLVVAAVAAFATGDMFQVPFAPGPFEAAAVLPVGVYVTILEVLLIIAILVGLEAALRSASVRSRSRIKFLALGIGGIFLVRFYLSSEAVAFWLITGDSLKIGAATLLVATALVASGVAREQLRDIDLTISRGLLYRSVVVIVLGMYLLAVALFGWLLNYFHIPEQAFWGSLVIFVSALGLAVLMLSDRVRWRIRRFVELNLYRSKYDYREHWVAFTKRMASLVTLEELGPELLETLTEAVGSERATLYLADEHGSEYRPAASIGLPVPSGGVAPDTPLVTRLRAEREPIALDGGADPILPSGLCASFGGGSVALPLVWRSTLAGFIVVGPERTGVAYGPEDLLFMATLGEQAAGSIVTARMSEALARAREFDAFNRLTSYVIHDIKNFVSALSLLARNALTHFNDPEFQQDSIRTLSRTVERMKGLLGKLGSPVRTLELAFEPVDLAALLEEVVGPVRAQGGLPVATDFRPMPPVLADAEALLRVFQNLLKNAAEAVSGSGTVTISLDRVEDTAVVSVADTGPGMSEEFVRTSLFAPFRSSKDGGWGIGLFQARDIVERHGGTITVTSTPGLGTTFRVHLPVVAEQSDRAATGVRRESA